MDSNFQFLVASLSEEGRDSSLENESGSVAEPRVSRTEARKYPSEHQRQAAAQLISLTTGELSIDPDRRGLATGSITPFPSTVWHRAFRRALRCGQPACAGQWPRRHGLRLLSIGVSGV